MQHSAKNKTAKSVSRTSPNFGRVCASAVLQKTIVDLDYWKLRFLKIVEDKRFDEANAKLSELIKRTGPKDVFDRVDSYLSLYAELVKDAKSDHDKIAKRIGKKRNYNITDEVKDMIAKMESSDALELNVDAKENRANRHIIRCIVDGLVSSIDTLVSWSGKYIETLKKTQTLLDTLDAIVNESRKYTDSDERTKKMLKKTVRYAKSIKTMLQNKYEMQVKNFETAKTEYITPQKNLLDKYYSKYAFLTGPESILSKKTPVSLSNKSRGRRTPVQASQNPQKEISMPGKNILQRYSPATKFSLRPPPPPPSMRNKTRKNKTILMPPLPPLPLPGAA